VNYASNLEKMKNEYEEKVSQISKLIVDK